MNKPYVTKRQLMIMQLLANGFTLAGAADHMGIVYESTRSMLKSAYKRTDTHSQVQLLAECFRRGLVE